MKLSEFAAELKSLKETISGFISDKTKATSEALSAFSAKLTAFESGTVAELSQKTSDLTTAQQTIGTTQASLDKSIGEVSAVNAQLKAACTALSLEVKDGATSAEMIAAMQGAVTNTLAKLQVDANKVPAGTATKAGESNTKGKLSLDEQVAAAKAQTTATK